MRKILALGMALAALVGSCKKQPDIVRTEGIDFFTIEAGHFNAGTASMPEVHAAKRFTRNYGVKCDMLHVYNRERHITQVVFDCGFDGTIDLISITDYNYPYHNMQVDYRDRNQDGKLDTVIISESYLRGPKYYESELSSLTPQENIMLEMLAAEANELLVKTKMELGVK